MQDFCFLYVVEFKSGDCVRGIFLGVDNGRAVCEINQLDKVGLFFLAL